MQNITQNQQKNSLFNSGKLVLRTCKSLTRSFVITLCLTAAIFLSGYSNNQQAGPISASIGAVKNSDDPFKIFKNWYLVIETSDHIEISARIVQCEQKGATQIHFNYFNESGEARTRTFSVKITNVDGRNFTIQKTVQATPAAMYIADCSKGTPVLDNLKIDLPADYNAEKVTISIIF